LMKILLSLSILISFFASRVTSQTIVVKETKEESKVCNLISRLPEVINADNYVKKATKTKRHLFSYLASAPTQDVPYYWVKVAEDNGATYHAHFHFYVEPKTYRIFYLDIVTDKILPESKCRKRLIEEYRIK
jgi:hypothetical protein